MEYCYRRLIKEILFILIFLFYLGGTSYPVQDSIPDNSSNLEKIKNEIVASVGPINITADEFYYSYEFGPAFVKRGKDSKERYLKYMINEKLLALDGYSRGIDKKEEVNDYVKKASLKSELDRTDLSKEKTRTTGLPRLLKTNSWNIPGVCGPLGQNLPEKSGTQLLFR